MLNVRFSLVILMMKIIMMMMTTMRTTTVTMMTVTMTMIMKPKITTLAHCPVKINHTPSRLFHNMSLNSTVVHELGDIK